MHVNVANDSLIKTVTDVAETNTNTDTYTDILSGMHK